MPVSREMLQELRRHGVYAPSIELVDTNGAATGVTILRGAGTPEGAVTASPGALFLRSDGDAATTLYVKTSGTGNTGWTAK